MSIGTPATATTILTWEGLAPETHLYQRPHNGETVGAIEVTVTLCVRHGHAGATVATKFLRYRKDGTFALAFGEGLIIAGPNCPSWVQTYIDAATTAHLEGNPPVEAPAAKAA